MDALWRILFFPPVALPIIAAAVGFGASVFILAKYPALKARRGAFLVVLVIVSLATACIVNASQRLYDLGLSFHAIDEIRVISYLIFGFAISTALRVSAHSGIWWLLVLLVPVAFAPPLLAILVFIGWSVNGFAP